ncbi:hypothetical protein [Clostridium tarantellae]|uniref:Uncharacterized protein n=1 Tax=Clostridium tarantellae TaxID=39493 RepID=A0A6I1MWK9_9CLOT|nr:hypothetical protein [Clostridium tarantellae]MPQ44559.1 hypothetical protein [Clostridium tarantellae]
MKHNSKNESISEDLTKLNDNVKINNPLESKSEQTLSNLESSDKIENINNYTSYVSNAYYYTGKSVPQFNIKTIIMIILGIIIIGASTFFYFNDKNNLNPFIGFAIGILLLLIALIQFIYKKN